MASPYIDNNTIALKMDKIGGAGSTYDEMEASAAITPGFLCEMHDDNFGGRVVRPHNTAGDPCETLFAVEAAYEGKGISDVYGVGDRVYLRIGRKGDLVLAWLDEAVPVTVVGQFLASNGDGTLRFYSSVTDEPGSIVCVAYEKTVSVAADRRIAVRIL